MIRNGQWAQGALRQVIMEHVRTFERMEDSYLSERGADVKELGQRVLAYMQDLRQKKVHFPDHTILVGEEVTPAMIAEIPPEKLKGVVSQRGSGNSHVAIMARALDIPTVMGALDLPLFAVDGLPLIVDGFLGHVFVNPSTHLIEPLSGSDGGGARVRRRTRRAAATCRASRATAAACSCG